MINYILKKIFGTQNERTLKKVWPIVHQINTLEPSIQALSDDALKAKTGEFKKRLVEGAALDDILPEAFAVVREASKRVLKMRQFDVQLLGGIFLHHGKIVEMSTGEGKTLVATCPVYLNALTGKGVHVVTVNDYLARRDMAWMGPLYEFLGLSIGVIQHDMDPKARRISYFSDITYGTNNEFGFDYLRDNMEYDINSRRQRELNFAIVDEVDSILVDEARTPLIISGPAEESTDKYYKIDRIIPRLAKDKDYTIDEKANTVQLTEDGVKSCESLMGVKNLYENTQIDLIHHVHQALRAHTLFKLDVDYVVKDNQVIIVDEFTGRLMPGRRFSDGLHQALEAKENVKIERENQTLATVTFQNFFRMYKKLSGMTGTAETEAIEFEKIYKLDVVVIPTNRPMIRKDHPDVIYRTEHEKFKAVIDEVASLYKEGRPVLVGTVSIEKSEHLSDMLRRRNIPHTVLNAKYHEKEAEIVAKAGQPFAITISTNMAGRGTDIVLGEGVATKGGLHVVGTERHEARRIDNQLRGRSGRQGDPGSSKFFLSLEDDLMRIFGSDRIGGLMQKMGMEEGQEIQHPLVTRAIAQAQKRVEARNFDIRKMLLEYDNVMNRQREVIYEERKRALESPDLKEHVLEMTEEVLDSLIAEHLNDNLTIEERESGKFYEIFKTKFNFDVADIKGSEMERNQEVIREELWERVQKKYDEKESRLTPPMMLYLEKYVMLQLIDSKWKDHLYSIDNLKEGIHLRAYGQRDPLVEYSHEAFHMFEGMIESIKQEAVEFIFKAEPVQSTEMANVFQTSRQESLHPDASKVGGIPKAKAGQDLDEETFPTMTESRATLTTTQERSEPKVGRNDPCPCGSGKKYKKCHGA
ncbi:MAG: preprotein translocase subunit SecA [Candidatus Omnitrophica bacterium]|nr:preprotein translocase subunit SecA [Candidatus Omnitrophota bacterium]